MNTPKITVPSYQCKLKILREEINEVTGKKRLQVQIPVKNGHSVIMMDRELIIDAFNFKKLLVSHGASIDLDFLEEMAALGKPPANTPEVTVVRRACWDGRRYINSTGEFGPTSDNTNLIEYDRSSPYFREPSKKGTVAAYLNGLAEPIAMSPTLLVALSSALVPALMLRLEETDKSYFIAISAESTTGKTLSTRVAHSVSSRANNADLMSMNMTHGRAGQLDHLSGTLAPFGDIKASQEKSKQLAERLQTFVFSLTDGVTRDRVTSEKTDPAEACVALISFEKPILEFFESCGFLMEDGDLVRILDIPVSSRAKGGIFDLAPDSASRLAKKVEKTIGNNHGVFLPYWIKYIGRFEIEELREIEQRYREIFDAMVGDLSSLEARYIEKLGWIYIAGRIALRSRKLKFVDLEVFNSHFALLIERVLNRFNAGDNELRDNIGLLKEALLNKASFPLVKIGEDADPEKCINGFRRKDDSGVFIYVRTEFVAKTISRRNSERVLREFVRAGALDGGANESTTPVAQKGLKRVRYLQFNFDKLQQMGSSDTQR